MVSLATACLAALIAGSPVIAAEAFSSRTEVRPLSIEVPSVEVLQLDGTAIDLHDVVGDNKAVVIFYRGGWCPYCNKQLAQLQSIESEIRELGFELLAVSADRPSNLQPSIDKHELGYTLYSDKTMAAARAYGIAFTMSAEGLARYKSNGIDLEAASGETHHQLPVPSVFIYRDGRMTFQYVNPNHRERADPEVILAAARAAAK